MAPSSSKKSLLRPWGSRRRERTSPEGQIQEPPLPTSPFPPPPLPTAGPSGRSAPGDAPAPPPDEASRSDPIDKLASALLDDSASLQQPREAQAETPAARPGRGQIPRSTTGIPSPFTMHPVFPDAQTAAAAVAAAAAHSAAGTADSRGSRPALAQSSSVQFPRQPKVRVPHNPLPRSRTTAFQPQEQFGPVPFRPPREPVDHQLSPLQAEAREVDQKVKAMLAATEALKSTPATPKTSQSVPSRVLNKVSSVWDRLHLSKSRGKLQKRPPPGSSAPQQVAGPQSPYQRPPNIRPEVDADDVVRRRDPQTLSGDRSRRPAAFLVQPDQLANIFSDDRPPLPHTPSPQEEKEEEEHLRGPMGDVGSSSHDARQRRESTKSADDEDGYEEDVEDEADEDDDEDGDNESAKSNVAMENPFETEVGFDSNLEDSILSTQPVAASTPRVLSRRSSLARSIDESALERGYSDVQINQAMVAVRVGDDGNGPGRARQVMLRPSASRMTVAQAESSGQQSTRPAQRVSQIRVSDKVKKHPSPSKKDLEDLEKAFQRNKAVLKPLLRSKDPNRLSRGAAWSRLHDADPLGMQSPYPSRRSRLPHSSLKIRREVRFAALSRRVAALYDCYDELR
ncbi:hypothetical protein CP532_2306 [Ophiocordyceps camponoti-leonardi (nom. inval.)]|nr:hypothetical protein CP532_2306 [Ophiocordyceps camponoti-leonardi (nom. inval.)]